MIKAFAVEKTIYFEGMRYCVERIDMHSIMVDIYKLLGPYYSNSISYKLLSSEIVPVEVLYDGKSRIILMDVKNIAIPSHLVEKLCLPIGRNRSRVEIYQAIKKML